MKVAGWILLVFALLILVRGGIAEALTFGVLGAYLLHRAKQKQEEKQEKINGMRCSIVELYFL